MKAIAAAVLSTLSLSASAACYDEVKNSLPQGGVAVFGEFHGTVEIPRFFGDCVQEFIYKGEKVAVFLELPAADNEVLARYVRGELDEQSLLRTPHWSIPDGRSSVAMLELMHRLKANAAALDGGAPRGVDTLQALGPAREQEMADNLVATRPADGYSLVLVGNMHARLARGTPWNADFESFALRAKRKETRLVSFDVRHQEGTAWACMPACGVVPMDPILAGVAATARPGVGIGGTDANFTGYFYVGKVQASPPASPVAKKHPSSN